MCLSELISLETIIVQYNSCIEYYDHIFQILRYLPTCIQSIKLIADPDKFRLKGYCPDLEREIGISGILDRLRLLGSVQIDLTPGDDPEKSMIASKVIKHRLPTLDARGLLQMIPEPSADESM